MRQDLDLPWVVCEYKDVFPDELPKLPPQRDVDFCIELHPGTSPISMTVTPQKYPRSFIIILLYILGIN